MRCLLPLLAFATVFAADAPAPLRVFLRCGPKTHGPGDHDHPAFARDWQPLLTHAGMKVSVGDADAKGVQTFPSDEELARTDVLVIHRQGGGDFKPDERARVAKFAARGGSFVVIHAGAVAGNDASADFYKDLVGGSWRQKVTKWREGPMQLKFVDQAHAISKGVADGHCHAGRVQQRPPVAGEGWVIVVARAVGLRAAAEEDAERGGGVGREGGNDGEQGQEAAHV